MPRHCEFITKADGSQMVVCYSGRRAKPANCYLCHRQGMFQCDFPTLEGHSCDRYLCVQHRQNRGVNVDYCPQHVAEVNSQE